MVTSLRGTSIGAGESCDGLGVALIIAGILLSDTSGWAWFFLVAFGVFALYEAAEAGVSCALRHQDKL